MDDCVVSLAQGSRPTCNELHHLIAVGLQKEMADVDMTASPPAEPASMAAAADSCTAESLAAAMAAGTAAAGNQDIAIWVAPPPDDSMMVDQADYHTSTSPTDSEDIEQQEEEIVQRMKEEVAKGVDRPEEWGPLQVAIATSGALEYSVSRTVSLHNSEASTLIDPESPASAPKDEAATGAWGSANWGLATYSMKAPYEHHKDEAWFAKQWSQKSQSWDWNYDSKKGGWHNDSATAGASADGPSAAAAHSWTPEAQLAAEPPQPEKFMKVDAPEVQESMETDWAMVSAPRNHQGADWPRSKTNKNKKQRKHGREVIARKGDPPADPRGEMGAHNHLMNLTGDPNDTSAEGVAVTEVLTGWSRRAECHGCGTTLARSNMRRHDRLGFEGATAAEASGTAAERKMLWHPDPLTGNFMICETHYFLCLPCEAQRNGTTEDAERIAMLEGRNGKAIQRCILHKASVGEAKKVFEALALQKTMAVPRIVNKEDNMGNEFIWEPVEVTPEFQARIDAGEVLDSEGNKVSNRQQKEGPEPAGQDGPREDLDPLQPVHGHHGAQGARHDGAAGCLRETARVARHRQAEGHAIE